VAEHPGLHNVPLRIAVENGIIAAIIWLGVTGKALLPIRRLNLGGKRGVRHIHNDNGKETAVRGLQGDSQAWWLLLGVVLLSLLDYYMWMGHLGGFWWLLVGLRLGGGRVRRLISRPRQEPVDRRSPAWDIPAWLAHQQKDVTG